MKQMTELSDFLAVHQGEINAVHGSNAAGWCQQLTTIVRASDSLMACAPQSIYDAAMMVAALRLSLNPKLGQALLVAYSGQCQYQLGYKGIIQLANRTGKFKHLGTAPVYTGQLKAYDPLKGTAEFDWLVDPNGEPVGYAAYMATHSGFERTLYMNIGAILKHAKKYVRNFATNKMWQGDQQGAMMQKTVIKMLLNTWAEKGDEAQWDEPAMEEEATAAYASPDAATQTADFEVKYVAAAPEAAPVAAPVAASAFPTFNPSKL